MHRLPVTLVVGFLLASTARASNTYYVSTGGSDSNNGQSSGAAFATFPKAISTATPGDTIFVLGGTYNLSSTLNISSTKVGSAASPFKLIAMPGETPVLNFAG